MNRRHLLHLAAAAAFQSNALDRVRAATSAAGARTPEEIAVDEDFWSEIRAAFSPYFSQAASTSLRALQKAVRCGRLPKIGIHPRNVYMQNEPRFLPRIENPPKIHAMRRGGARLCPSPPAENI
jgi:hypothetical protein